MGCSFVVHASFWCHWVHCKIIIVAVECSHWYWSACQKHPRLDQVALSPGFTQKHCTVSQKSPERSFKVAQTRCAAHRVSPMAQMPSKKWTCWTCRRCIRMTTHYPNCCIEKSWSDSADVLCCVSQSNDSCSASSDTCIAWHCIKVLVMSRREGICGLLSVCEP